MEVCRHKGIEHWAYLGDQVSLLRQYHYTKRADDPHPFFRGVPPSASLVYEQGRARMREGKRDSFGLPWV